MNANFKANYAVFVKNGRTFMAIKDMINDVNLSCQARILFQLISSHSVIEGYCYATNRYLTTKMGLSESRVKIYLKELIDAELVRTEMEDTDYGKRRRIYIRFDKMRRRYLALSPEEKATKPRYDGRVLKK